MTLPILFSKIQKARNNKSSYARDVTIIKNLEEFFGGKRLAEITPIFIEEYKGKRLKEGKAPATVNREVGCLKCMFNWAIKNNKAAENRQFENDTENIRFFEKRRGTQVAEGAGLLKRKIPDEKSKPRR